MTLLSIIHDSCDLLGLRRPTVVVDSTDDQVRQLLALANEEGKSLLRSFNWQRRMKQHTFTSVDDAIQPTAIPDDIEWYLPNSFFNRTTRRPVLGPISPQLWQNIQANPQINRVILAYRLRENDFLITPNPPTGQTIAFEYMSRNWVLSADGLEEFTRWEADTNTTFLEEDLFPLGIRWRWKKTKGLPYGEDFATYNEQLAQFQARDGGSTVLNQTGGGDWVYVGNPNIPETGFGSS
jgi:hypothetical protein